MRLCAKHQLIRRVRGVVQRCEVKIRVRLLKRPERRDIAAAAKVRFVEDENSLKTKKWMD